MISTMVYYQAVSRQINSKSPTQKFSKQLNFLKKVLLWTMEVKKPYCLLSLHS